MASSEDSTICASRERSSSARRCSVTSRKTLTAMRTLPPLVEDRHRLDDGPPLFARRQDAEAQDLLGSLLAPERPAPRKVLQRERMSLLVQDLEPFHRLLQGRLHERPA